MVNRLSAAALLLGAALPVQASQACPVSQQGHSPEQLAQLLAQPQITAQWLDSLQAACLVNAAYYRLLGLAQSKLGRTSQAIDATERALLHEPNHPETLLNYALLLAQAGDTVASQDLFRQVFARPDVPPQVAALYQTLLQNIPPVPQVQPAQPPLNSPNAHGGQTHRWQFSQSVGHSTNLNSAPSATQLTLTLPQGSVTLPVAPSGQAVAGAQAHTQIAWSRSSQNGPQAWMGSASLTQRQSALGAARSTQADLAALWLQNTTLPAQYLALASLQHTTTGTEARNQTRKLAAGREWSQTLPGCKTTVLAEVSRTRYLPGAIESGRYLGASLGHTCAHGLGLQWRSGQDTPQDPQRAGGVQTKNEWFVQSSTQWAGAQQTINYNLARQRDASGYSPLLAQGQARSIIRQTLRLEWAQPLPSATPAAGASVGGGARGYWFVAFETSTQRSNLALFASQSKAIHLGIKWGTP